MSTDELQVGTRWRNRLSGKVSTLVGITKSGNVAMRCPKGTVCNYMPPGFVLARYTLAAGVSGSPTGDGEQR